MRTTYLLRLTCFFVVCIVCSGIFSPALVLGQGIFQERIDSIPARQYSAYYPQSHQETPNRSADVSHLRQPASKTYLLDAGDTVGVFVEGVLGEQDSNPPIHYPEPGSDLPPALGYPVVVQSDGTISLPLVSKVYAKGLSISQLEGLIKRAYFEGTEKKEPILKSGNRVLTSLIRKRTYNITVVRQDNSTSQFARSGNLQTTNQAVSQRSDFSARGTTFQLPAEQNDVLNALIQSGGVPGVNAKPAIRVDRSNRIVELAGLPGNEATSLHNQPFNEFPRTATGITQAQRWNDKSHVAIQTHRSNDTPPGFYGPDRTSRSDSILRDGDIVYVDAKPTEVYYTGGLLGGGEFLLPRDTTLDVVQAVARAGNAIGRNNGGRAGAIPPTELLVLRRQADFSQITIRVDLNRALNDPAERLQVQAGDTLILRYTPQEQLRNFGRDVFFTYGLRELIR